MKDMAKKEWANLTAIANHLIFTEKKVAAYYLLSPTRYDYVDDKKRMENLYEMNAMLSGLSDVVEGQQIEIKPYVMKTPIDVNEWARGLTESVRSMNDGSLPKSFRSGLKSNFEYVSHSGYARSSVYLEVTIGKRDSLKKNVVSDNPFSQAVGVASNLIEKKVLSSRDQEVSQEEIEAWMDIARRFDIVMDRYDARKATGGEIAAIYRRFLYPSMNIPKLPGYERWGRGDIIYLSESEIEKKPKFNKISQLESTGYSATLAFQKFPENMSYPSSVPWIIAALYNDDNVGKYTFWGSFSLVGPRQVKKDLVNVIKMAKDEERDAANAGLSPISVTEKLDLAEELESFMSKSNDPWAYGSYFITVTGKTKKELEDNILAITQDYRSRDIIVSYPTGIQYPLLLASLPGGEVPSKRWIQRQPISIIGGGSPTVNSAVGD